VSEIFTSWLAAVACAFTDWALTLRAVPAAPMLPAVEVRLRFVAVMLLTPELVVMEAADTRLTVVPVTELLIEMAPGSVQVEQVSVKLMLLAVMLPVPLPPVGRELVRVCALLAEKEKEPVDVSAAPWM
jgi:hypothetical protein